MDFVLLIGTAYNLRDFRPSCRFEKAALATPPPDRGKKTRYLAASGKDEKGISTVLNDMMKIFYF